MRVLQDAKTVQLVLLENPKEGAAMDAIVTAAIKTLHKRSLAYKLAKQLDAELFYFK